REHRAGWPHLLGRRRRDGHGDRRVPVGSRGGDRAVPHRPEPDHAARALPRARRDREPDRVPVQPEVLGHERHGGTSRRRCADLDALTPVPVAAAGGRAKVLPVAATGDGTKILPYTWPQPALRAEATQGARSSLAAQRGGGVTPSRTAP